LMKFTGLCTFSFALLVEIAGGAAPSKAEDFTFVIPVDVSHLPSDVASMNITCEVQMPGLVIGQSGPHVIPITGGTFHGDVTIAFNVSSGRDPALATQYDCSAYFIGRGAVPAFYFQTSTSPTFPLRSGAPFFLETHLQPIPR